MGGPRRWHAWWRKRAARTREDLLAQRARLWHTGREGKVLRAAVCFQKPRLLREVLRFPKPNVKKALGLRVSEASRRFYLFRDLDGSIPQPTPKNNQAPSHRGRCALGSGAWRGWPRGGKILNDGAKWGLRAHVVCGAFEWPRDGLSGNPKMGCTEQPRG